MYFVELSLQIFQQKQDKGIAEVVPILKVWLKMTNSEMPANWGLQSCETIQGIFTALIQKMNFE